ncbi:MAG: hypothetical protein JWR19_261 [Pedosphaera sp.]|nr:hypothetical protein [Pedosphaera sp.]
MSELKIDISQVRTAFQPGEELMGTASWKLDQPPRAVELRLFWFTRGKGTEDAGMVETVRFDRPASQEMRPFRFKLPDAPYSFSGTLISLIWALELVAEPSKAVARVEIVVAPDGQEVRLDSVPESETGKIAMSWGTR